LPAAITKVADAPDVAEEDESEDADTQNPEAQERPTPSQLRARVQELRRQECPKASMDEWHDYMASLLDISDSDQHEKEFLAICQMILRNGRGSDYPAEELIQTLVMDYIYAGALTPAIVQREVDQFIEDYEDLIDDAKRVLAEYPDAVKAAPAAAEEGGN
jgi:hypothetical protein